MSPLYYFHDPMCSWCWGYRPVATRLFAGLPNGIERIDVLGGLAADNDRPMPVEQRKTIQGHWRRIESLLGTEFNHDFWRLNESRRSTYPSCRAVIAAERQRHGNPMVHAIQRAYYLHAKNPSDVAVLVALADELGLDVPRFEHDLGSNEVNVELDRQLRFTRRSGVTGFPSLMLEHDNRTLPIAVDYRNHETTLDELRRALGD